MLTLRIKAGERITIGEDVSVYVYRWRGDSVELAVDAPKEIAVRRQGAKGSENRPVKK